MIRVRDFEEWTNVYVPVKEYGSVVTKRWTVRAALVFTNKRTLVTFEDESGGIHELLMDDDELMADSEWDARSMHNGRRSK